jgi:hypothetical protein
MKREGFAALGAEMAKDLDRRVIPRVVPVDAFPRTSRTARARAARSPRPVTIALVAVAVAAAFFIGLSIPRRDVVRPDTAAFAPRTAGSVPREAIASAPPSATGTASTAPLSSLPSLPSPSAAPTQEASAKPARESWLETADSDALFMESQRARSANDPLRARAALLALRRRFPGDSRASAAAFTLGAIASDNAHDASEALEWFKTYLHEAPDGALAREATGRAMELSHSLGRSADARKFAASYLIHYRGGPQTEQATQIFNEQE